MTQSSNLTTNRSLISWPEAKEAFLLRRINKTIIVTGYDASGTLYGALELATDITPHVGFTTTTTDGQPPNLDWLFED